MLFLPNYTLIVGYLFVLLSFWGHSSASRHLLKFFFIPSRLNTQAVNYRYFWTVPLKELYSPSSNLHTNFLKVNLLKFELQQEIQPYWADFSFTRPLNLNSRVLDAWKICAKRSRNLQVLDELEGCFLHLVLVDQRVHPRCSESLHWYSSFPTLCENNYVIVINHLLVFFA